MEPYEGREPYIFISYARKDAERVLPYLDALSGADYRVWYDKGISAGDEWLKKLEEKVANCEVFCPIFSQAFNDSYYCFRETGYACWRDKKIVPLYLEEVGESLRLMFRLLKSLQHLRLDDCNPAQFAERLDGEQAFKDCKVPRNAPPEGWQKVGQIQWRLSADGILTIERNEDLGFYCSDWNGVVSFIPSHATASIPSYQYDPVYVTSAPWAPYREKIHSVEIADNIDVIGDSAFWGCESLTNVRIPDSMKSIGDKAFQACKSLTNVHIPDSITEIRDSAFALCESLTDVRIPDSVIKIGNNAFSSCVSLTNVCIPDGVIEIGNCAFEDCISLTNVRIPDSVTSIGSAAFFHCFNLKSVEIPTGAKRGLLAFWKDTLVTRRPAP